MFLELLQVVAVFSVTKPHPGSLLQCL